MKFPVFRHIGEHTWLWIAGFAVLGAVMAMLRLSTPAAVSFMVVGLLIMMKSQGTSILSVVTADPVPEEEAAESPASGTIAAPTQKAA
ncbi:hypothetical protein [Siccirubricoccus sp. G192]|uniref:hypothetical protein n=1 Tax=Siccirubricoccus sp. G192 TaxID=2849651 RepID=UPI001C2C822B|nr:hypothetical protein [Siccirubricoccus sp. G192]MBV1799803.1 hypothetical protein [Siccirubricoccus sp. G192]